MRCALAVAILLFTAAIWLVADAPAQLFFPPVPIPTASGPPFNGLTPTQGAYSIRLLRTAFVGSPIRLRRASDSTQQDIGFTGAGDLNTAAATTFCNATSCFVAKWYDQSGNTLDLAQGTAALQPAFAFSCQGSFPCVSFTPGSLSLAAPSLAQAAGIVSFSVVLNRATGTGICVLPGVATNTVKTRSGTAGLSLNGSSGSITTTSADATWHSANTVINAAGSYMAVDGSTTSGSVTGSTSSAAPTLTGITSTTCNVLEVAIWEGYALLAGEAASLNTNQHGYYGF